MQRNQEAPKERANGEGELTSLFRLELAACGDPDVAAARVERRMHLLNLLAAARMLIALSEIERYQADLDVALAQQPGDGPLSAFNRAAKIITAFDVEQIRRAKTRTPAPTRALTDVDFDYEQPRINDDWFIR